MQSISKPETTNSARRPSQDNEKSKSGRSSRKGSVDRTSASCIDRQSSKDGLNKASERDHALAESDSTSRQSHQTEPSAAKEWFTAMRFREPRETDKDFSDKVAKLWNNELADPGIEQLKIIPLSEAETAGQSGAGRRVSKGTSAAKSTNSQELVTCIL